MPFLDQILPDAVRPALQPGRRNFASRFHFQTRENIRVAVLRLVLHLDVADAGARSGLHVHDNIHLVDLRVRRRLRGNLRPIQAFITERLSQPLQRFINDRAPVGLPQRDLHRRRCRGFARRRGKTLNPHLVEKQILPHYEIQSRAIRFRSYHRA